MSNKDSILLALGVLLFLSIVIYIASNKEQNKLVIVSYNYEVLKKDALELDSLKKKYTEGSKILDELRRYKGFIKESKNSNVVKFEYSLLNATDLDNLSNRVINSSLNIKSLKINRDDDFNSSLEFEVSM